MSNVLRLAMFGTGIFALPTFRGLFETPHQVVGLVTQPDRTGRGHHTHVNPMKELAEARGVPVFQPDNANLPESLDRLRSFQADLFVVAAYGQILSADLLQIPRLGAINLHASLLPKYRGAAPIQYAVIHGETETGITIFQIEPKLDAGPILGVVKLDIGTRETYGELETRLADVAVPLAQRVIQQIADGTTEPQPQDPTKVTKARRFKKFDGEVPWSKSSRLVDCHIRGVQPWPRPSASLQTQKGVLRLLILEVAATDHAVAGEPGTVDVVDRKRLFVKTGDGALEVMTIQAEGKRAMTTAEFLRGHVIQSGDRFEVPVSAQSSP